MARTTEEVLRDHLALRAKHDLEADIARNYAPDVTMIRPDAVAHGHDGVRRFAALLACELPDLEFEADMRVDGEIALLVWRARGANGARVDDGVDTFVVRDGRIVAQTIRYTLKRS